MKARRPIDSITFDAMVDFTAAGQREVAPVFLNDDRNGLLGIHGAHGLYRMGIHADGRPVVLFSTDPHNLDPVQHRDEKFRRKFAPGYYLDPAKVGNIEVVSARPMRQQKKWVMEAIHNHSFHYNELRTEYGFLYRLSENVWASNAAIYTLDPLSPKHPDYKDGVKKLVLRCYTASGRSLPIAEMAEKLKDGTLPRILKMGASKTIVTAGEAEEVIRDDFVKRMELLLRDRDPGLLGRIKGEPELSSRLSPYAEKIQEKARRGASHLATRAVQVADRQIRTIKTRYVAMGFAKTLALSLIQFMFKGWRASVGQVVMGVFQPVLDALRQADHSGKRTEDVAQSFWITGRSARTGNRHYCRIDPGQARFVRLLGYDESNVRPVMGAQLQNRLPADWAEDYILDTLGSPPGSIMEKHHIGGTDILYVKQPNGIAVHYLIAQKVAYAVNRPDLCHPLADALPQPVRALMERLGPIVKVHVRPDGTLASAGVRLEDFESDVHRECAKSNALPLTPRVDYDLSLLNEFAQRANPLPLPQTAMGKAIAVGFNTVTRARTLVGLPQKTAEQDNSPTAVRRLLDYHLNNRGPE